MVKSQGEVMSQSKCLGALDSWLRQNKLGVQEVSLRAFSGQPCVCYGEEWIL